MRQPIVKDLRSKTKVKVKAKAKDFIKCPRGASRPIKWPRGLHHCALVKQMDWAFNSKPTKKGQFLPTVGQGNWLKRLRMANKIQCTIPYVT